MELFDLIISCFIPFSFIGVGGFLASFIKEKNIYKNYKKNGEGNFERILNFFTKPLLLVSKALVR